MKHFRGFLLSAVFGLLGCAPVSSQFSCDKTAGDSCLTIEQVDAMTRFADDPMVVAHRHHKQKSMRRSQVYLGEKEGGTDIWIANKGMTHANNA